MPGVRPREGRLHQALRQGRGGGAWLRPLFRPLPRGGGCAIIGTGPPGPSMRGHDGIGRHARFRFSCSDALGFESPCPHQMDKGRSIEQFSWNVQYSYPHFMGESLDISGFLSSHVWPAHFIAKMKFASLMVEKRKIPSFEPFVQISLSALSFAHGAIQIYPVSYS